MSNELTAPERSDLRKHEQQIEDGVKSVGVSLLAIRDGLLFRETHQSFAAYCEDRWGFKKRYVQYLLQAEATRAQLCTVVHLNDVPTKERHLRELAKAPEEIRVDVLERANELAATADREPTANDFREARLEFEEPEPDPEPDDEYEYVEEEIEVEVEYEEEVDDGEESEEDRALRLCRKHLHGVEMFRKEAFDVPVLKPYLPMLDKIIEAVKTCPAV